MSAAVVVTGAGAISSLGDSPEQLHAALVAGASGIGPITLFPTDGLGCRWAGEVRDFEPTRYLGERNLRPLDRTSRLVASAAQRTLAASGWSSEALREHEVGLVLGTMFGSLRTIAEFDRRALELGPGYASPLDFANSVINAPAGQAAIWHQLRGTNATLAGGPVAGLAALAFAADQLRSGRGEALLAGGADELCLECLVGCERLGLVAGADGAPPRAVPFAAGRRGFVLGEGAALLMLETAESAVRRGASILAAVAGHGQTFDPSRGRDEASAADALARAIRLALADAGLPATAIDVASVSACGSPVGDRVEARALVAALGATAATLPIVAVKAQLGECLGASAALQALAVLGLYATGEAPGIAGLDHLEKGLRLGGAVAESRRLVAEAALLTAVGLDGQVAAVVMTRGT